MSAGDIRVDQPYRLRADTIRVSIWTIAAAWVGRRFLRALLLLIRTPILLIVLAILITAGVVVVRFGWLPVVSSATLVATALVLWRLRWPASFDRWIWLRARGSWRNWWVVRRRWTRAMVSCGLAGQDGDHQVVPPVLHVTSTRSVDRVRLRMLAGHTIEDYTAVADRLAQTFGAVDGRIRSVPGKPHQVELWLLTHDPLLAIVPPFPIREELPADGLPVALAEDGSTWRLRLVGSHVLVVGATGAGKGSVLWSILVALAPAIRASVVKVWAVDPKGGMELAPGRNLFDRFCHGGLDDTAAGYETGFAELLEDAVQVMRRRQDRLRGVTRLHTPSVGEPLIVIIIDELAAVTGWILDRTIKKRIETALGLLLSQGRAVGVVVVGAVQDPRKDVLPMRDLFPTRIALRLNEAEQVHLALGAGARNRGAYCDLIRDTVPGVGYVAVDGIAEPVRVRFSHITDDQIVQVAGQDTTATVRQIATFTTLAMPETVERRPS